MMRPKDKKRRMCINCLSSSDIKPLHSSCCWQWCACQCRDIETIWRPGNRGIHERGAQYRSVRAIVLNERRDELAGMGLIDVQPRATERAMAAVANRVKSPSLVKIFVGDMT